MAIRYKYYYLAPEGEVYCRYAAYTTKEGTIRRKRIKPSYLPYLGKPGWWFRRIKNPVMCKRGYHVLRPRELLWWWPGESKYMPRPSVLLAQVEVEGYSGFHCNKTVWKRMRILRAEGVSSFSEVEAVVARWEGKPVRCRK